MLSLRRSSSESKWSSSYWSSLTPRARTIWVGAVVSVALLAVAGAVPIPYVAEGPGVTYNTLGSVDGTEVISFTGSDIPAAVDEPTPDGSHLNMTTISVYDSQTLFGAIGLWAQGDFALVPRSEVFPPDKSEEQVNQENAQMFSDSQSAAEIAALRYLDYPNVVYVGTIPADSPSSGVLQPQDQITAVDGTAVTDYDSLRAAMSTTRPGQTISVQVLRNGATATESVTLIANTDVGPQGFLGIGAAERPKAPFTVGISLAGIGGPSAGLMFTLGIIDKLTPGDLTGGHFIAGTGTMEVDDDLATVGPIGGILMKEIAARDAGAAYFLVPAANCDEAKTRVPDGLQLVKVGTLDEAMSALETLGDGGTPPGC